MLQVRILPSFLAAERAEGDGLPPTCQVSWKLTTSAQAGVFHPHTCPFGSQIRAVVAPAVSIVPESAAEAGRAGAGGLPDQIEIRLESEFKARRMAASAAMLTHRQYLPAQHCAQKGEDHDRLSEDDL